MRDASSAVVANLPVPKARWILVFREVDMGCIINMDERL